MRRVVYSLIVAFIAAAVGVALDLRTRELILQAGSATPSTQYLPEPVPPLLPPEPAQVPLESPAPDFPPVATAPGELLRPTPEGKLTLKEDEPAYVGPSAPEYQGSPAPPDSGLLDGWFFQHPVRGLHPEMLRRLQLVASAGAETVLGVEMIVGFRKGSRSHSRGLAIDINYFANPYLMHESGESEQDRRLGPVYHRISRMMLGRNSVIPEAITQGSPDPERTLRLYRALREESRAMVAYFRLMQDPTALRAFLASHQPGVPQGDEALRQQMASDYVTLSGRPGPSAPGLIYPAAAPADGDPPFSGDPTYRGPELGFMNLREELVRRLTDAGFRWGGTDMGENSGDLMHFYLRDTAVK